MEEGISFELWLIGSPDMGNPKSFTQKELKKTKAFPFVKVFAFTEDVRTYICKADCVFLPSSYREGISGVLLEAMAMKKTP